MDDALYDLCGAVDINTAPYGFSFGLVEGVSADRAMCGKQDVLL
jgi:hypothetical protein